MNRSEIDDISSKFEARKLRMTHNKDGHVLALSINPADTPEDLMRDILGQRYMVVLVRINDQEEPVDSPDKEEGRRAVKQAAALCQDENFQVYMSQKYGGNGSAEETAEALRGAIHIKSRAELGIDKAARGRFKSLLADFNRTFRMR